MTKIPIGLQLYTVRDAADENLSATLKSLSDMGYVNVELAGFYGLTPTELKREFDTYGLTPVSAHVGLDAFANDDIAKTIEGLLTLGIDHVAVPYIGEDLRQGGAGYATLALKLGAAAETIAHYGLKLGYHNHDFELRETYEGKPGLEILIEGTDPSQVFFELDTYWALHADVDPVAFLNKYPGRFELIHIKDMDPADKFFAEIGTGKLPLDAIVAAAPAAGAQFLIVEQDSTRRPPLESVKISLDHLKSKGYA